MRANGLGTKVLMTVVCLVVLVYFGLQGYRYFNDPLTTTIAYAYQEEEATTVTGYVVRREQVLPEETGLLRLSRGEGEKVAKGGRLAVVYSSAADLQRQEEIQVLQTRIDQLRYAQEAALSSEAGLKLDNQIMTRIMAFRSSVAADRLAEAENHAAQLRSLVLKRDYTYAGGGDLEANLQELEGQLKALRSQAAASSRAVTAPVSGVYSAVTDGYESVLTPESLEGLTPSALNALKPSGETSQVGKLITGDEWYYAASLSAAEAKLLEVGETLKLRFIKGDRRDLEVTVRSLSKEEGGRVAAVFSSRQYLSELTLLRRQSADIILDTIDGIRIPSTAIRVAEDGTTGLYCVVGMRARFKPVTVVYTAESGYALVQPAAAADGRELLRPGDQVIINAKNLYEGKIVG